jgi:hypothetical protein
MTTIRTACFGRLILASGLVVGLLSVGTPAAAGRSEVVWQSRQLRVTWTKVRASGFYTFENRTGRTIRFSCVWATSRDRYQPPSRVRSLAARLRPDRDRTLRGDRPADIECASARRWPVLPATPLLDGSQQFSDDVLEVYWYHACAARDPDDCVDVTLFQNRAHRLTSFTCTYTTDGGTQSRWGTGALNPYKAGKYTSRPEPDPGSMSCTTETRPP